MYGIGEKVIYGAQGVMEIVDITDQTLGDVTHKYYVMKEYALPTSSLTYVPVDNEMLTANIHPLLTKDEIYELLDGIKNAPETEWIEENRARSEAYKRILASADRMKIISMIQFIRKTGIRREQEGKKNFIADENVMKKAEKVISVEFSLVLGIPESEASELINKNI